MAALVGCTGSPPSVTPSTPSASGPIGSPSISETPAASASSTPNASAVAESPSASTPAPTASPLPAGWQQVWPEAGGRPRALTAVVALEDGFVAAGEDRVTLAPVAMASADGLTWTDERITGTDVYPFKLAVWGRRVLAVGAGRAPCPHPFGLDAWVRSAAGAWSEAPFADLFCLGSDVSVVIVDGQPVLAGSGPGDSPVAWSSRDGLNWNDHSQAFAGLVPAAITGDGSSAVLFAESPTGPRISTSADGSHWSTPAPIGGLPANLVIDDAFWIDGAPTLIASEGDVVGSVRPDGHGGWQWAKADGIAADQLRGVTPFDGGLLAVTGGTKVRAWVSRDGVMWRPLTLPGPLLAPGGNVAGVAVRGDRTVLVGSLTNSGGDQISAIFAGPASILGN
jgi:hypothetical protein